MDIKPNPKLTASPFHRGEQAIQEKLGVREQMERFGSRVIRDHMPQQHRDFYQQLPFIFVGHGDRMVGHGRLFYLTNRVLFTPQMCIVYI